MGAQFVKFLPLVLYIFLEFTPPLPNSADAGIPAAEAGITAEAQYSATDTIDLRDLSDGMVPEPPQNALWTCSAGETSYNFTLNGDVNVKGVLELNEHLLTFDAGNYTLTWDQAMVTGTLTGMEPLVSVKGSDTGRFIMNSSDITVSQIEDSSSTGGSGALSISRCTAVINDSNLTAPGHTLSYNSSDLTLSGTNLRSSGNGCSTLSLYRAARNVIVTISGETSFIADGGSDFIRAGSHDNSSGNTNIQIIGNLTVSGLSDRGFYTENDQEALTITLQASGILTVPDGQILDISSCHMINIGEIVNNGTMIYNGNPLTGNGIFTGNEMVREVPVPIGITLAHPITGEPLSSPAYTGSRPYTVFSTEWTDAWGETIHDGNFNADAEYYAYLTLKPSDGYAFKGRYPAGLIEGPSGQELLSAKRNQDGTLTIVYTFNPAGTLSHSISVITGNHGTAAADMGSAEKDSVVRLNSYPDPGYRLKGWSTEPSSLHISGNTFVMPDSPVTVTAIFERVYEVTVQNDGYGSANTDANREAAGGTVTLRAVPNTNYVFERWEIISGDVNPANLYRAETAFRMPAQDVLVRARFKPALKPDPKPGNQPSQGSGNGPIQRPDEYPAIIPVLTDLRFTDRSSYDIPSGLTYRDISTFYVDDSVSGGQAPYTFRKLSGPSWLTVSSYGKISGTRPSSERDETRSVIQVTDQTGTARSITIHIGEVRKSSNRLSFSDRSAYDIPAGAGSTAISTINVAVSASGGRRPYTFKLSSGPSWLSVSSDGKITGIRPAAAQEATTAVIKVSDKAGTSRTITIKVGAVTKAVSNLTFNDSSAYDIPTGTVSTTVNVIDVAAGASGGETPYTFSKMGGPSWLKVSSDGKITGTRPDTAHVAVTAVIQVTDNAGSAQSIAINIGEIRAAASELVFTDSSSFDILSGTANTAIQSVNVAGSAGGGSAPYTFSKVSGPSWLAVSANGLITGTRPASAQAADTAVIQVADQAGAVKSISIHIGEVIEAIPELIFTSSSAYHIPAGAANTAIGTIHVASGASGGKAPYTFSKVSGPSWLTVSADGNLTGIRPAAAQTAAAAVIQVSDQTGAAKTITINVGEVSAEIPPPATEATSAPEVETTSSPETEPTAESTAPESSADITLEEQ